MSFFSSFKRFYSIFKNPLAKATIFRSSNLSNNTTPTLLFSRAHNRVPFSSLTQLRFYHGTHYTNGVKNYVVRKWGSWSWDFKLYHCMTGCMCFCWLVFCNWETVPYTNRRHYIPSNHVFDFWFDKLWHSLICDDKFEKQILDENNPICRRVFNITKDLLRTLEKDLKLGEGSMELSYGTAGGPTKTKLVQKKSWLQRRQERKVGKYHLDGLHWELIVADTCEFPTGVLPNGKIIVTTDMLKRLETDHDIATLIGHEVGHVVGRHTIESMMIEPVIVTIAFLCRLGILLPFINWWYLDWRKDHIDYPVSRRLEAEADRIGLMLVASAGYDPRMVPDYYLKLAGDHDKIPTHPTTKERAEMLRQESIMQEAVAVYNKVISESKQYNES